MTDRPRPDSAQAILALAGGFRASRTVLAAWELDVFTAIGAGAASAEVAARIGADARATDRLLNALVALGLLDKEDGRFTLTPAAARHLVRGQPEALNGLDHTAHLYRGWSTLDAAVRAGGSVRRDAGDDPAATEAFIAAMHTRARHSADALAAQLDMSGVRRVLDVGGGSGVFSMAFCRARPGLTAVVLDRPEVVALTRKYADQAGMAGRIETVADDYHTAEFGEGFDLVLFSSVVHINGPDENRALMGKAYDALLPGGRIVVADYVMEPDRTTPADGALFALNMLVNTAAGDTYTEAEIGGWLTAAGCDPVSRDGDGPRALMIGVRPG